MTSRKTDLPGRGDAPRPDEAEPPSADPKGRASETSDDRPQPGTWGGEGGAGEYQGGPTTSRTPVSDEREKEPGR